MFMSVFKAMMQFLLSRVGAFKWALICVFLSACQTPPDKIKHKLSDNTLADIALQSGDMRSAIGLYQNLLANYDKNQPDNLTDKVSLLVPLAQAYRALGQSELAIHYLKQANMISPDSLLSWRELGFNYMDQQQYDAAKDAFGFAININNMDISSLNGMGIVCSWLKDYHSAHKYLIQALALKPGNIEYKNNLALNYILQHEYRSAISLLLPLYQQQRSTAKMRNNLALALTLNGNEDYARQVLAKDFNQQQIEQNINYYQFSHKEQILPAKVDS
jgi:Flp pilus assembly protein TadD